MEGNLGERLRIARRQAGISQKQLGEEVGACQATIYKIENGKMDNSTFLDAIADRLGVSPPWLRYGDDLSPVHKCPIITIQDLSAWNEKQPMKNLQYIPLFESGSINQFATPVKTEFGADSAIFGINDYLIIDPDLKLARSALILARIDGKKYVVRKYYSNKLVCPVDKEPDVLLTRSVEIIGTITGLHKKFV